MSERELNGGRIAIELEGREVYLEPSLEACAEISGMAGGMNQAVQRCLALDFDTICRVIGAGVMIDGKRLSPVMRNKELPKTIYEAGLIYCHGKAIEFIHCVANGGRMPEEIAEDKGGEGDGPLFPSPNTTEDSSVEPLAG